MNVSYRWLRELAPTIPGSAQEAADRLTSLGVAVDDVVPLDRGLEQVVVARVERVRRHPNADRLMLCDVQVGNGTVQVVTGAPQVVEGGYYPFIGAGGTLPSGAKIERAKMRGEVSDGMLCSERELGLGRDAGGIMQLHGEFEVGAPIVEALGLDDVRLVLDVTANRGDLLGHWGVDRELAKGGVRDLRLPPFPEHVESSLDFAQGAESAAAGVPIRIEDADGCARYVGVVVRGVTVRPSPEWLASRLRAVGVRPINNVVDATNYVLYELNQPIHAFDLDTVHGPAIVVRRARKGERIRTLDDVDRKLDPEVLVIADADRPVAVAGIMGGAETEVSERTKDLLIEVAWFEPKRVRAGSRFLGIDTDASHRFQRGMDPEGVPAAVHRVVELILTVAGGRRGRGGRVEGAAGDAYPRPWKAPVVTLRPKRVSTLLGVAFPEKEIRAHLEPLGLGVEGSGAKLDVRVPSWRPDLTREIDVIEEVARRFGYDEFSDELRHFRPGLTADSPVHRAVDRIRREMGRLGFLEARTVAFVPESEGEVPIANPLSEEEGHLRRWLLPGLVHRVEHNLARRVRDVRLFEAATVFITSGGERPDEELHLAAAWTGHRSPPHWSEEVRDFDLWDLKGFLEEVAPLVAGPDALVRPLDPQAAEAWSALPLEPNAFVVATPDGAAVGGGGRIRADAVDSPPWAGAVFGFEIALRSDRPVARRYEPIPVFPAIERDLAIVVPAGTPAAAVEDAIRRAAPETLEALQLFDVYEGEKIPAGHRSLAFRLRFRGVDRTLTDEEVDEAVSRVIRHLKEALHVSIRGE